MIVYPSLRVVAPVVVASVHQLADALPLLILIRERAGTSLLFLAVGKALAALSLSLATPC
jgi:hypothetical protein